MKSVQENRVRIKKAMFKLTALALYTILVVSVSAFAFGPKSDVIQAPVMVDVPEPTQSVAPVNEEEEVIPDVIIPVCIQEEIAEPLPIEETIYTIQPGDCFWNLASKYYGDGSLCDKLAYANDMSIHDNLNIGMDIKIPASLNDIVVIEQIEEVEEPAPAVANNDLSYSPEDGLASVFNARVIEDYSNLEYYGECNITGYTPWCAHCCGKTDGITASGKEAVVGVTAGMVGLPLGTNIYIDGYGYFTVQDTGNVNNYWVDLACYSHDDCYDVTGFAKVYIVK